MAIADTYELVINYLNNYNKERFATVLHLYQNSAGDSLATMQEFTLDLKNRLVADLMPSLNVDMVLTSVRMSKIYPVPRSAPYELVMIPVPGGNNAEALPPQCAMLVKKRTAFAGRKFRGRLYQPGMSENDQASGKWAGQRYDDVFNFWTQELTQIWATATGGELMYVVTNKTGFPTYQIVQGVQDTIVRTQRRRVQGVGT